MLTCRTLALALTAALLAGASPCAGEREEKENKIPDAVKAVLDKADSFELLSLEPSERKEAKGGFHGWKVLGKTEVKDADTRKDLVAALEKGVAENKGEVAKCFEPRHGIRATRDKKTVELVICFECLQVRGYVDNSDKNTDGFLTSKSPQPAFDKVLKGADVPLPEPAGE
jgi:hypothetical protein